MKDLQEIARTARLESQETMFYVSLSDGADLIATIKRLEAEVAELKHLHANQMANALAERLRAESAEAEVERLTNALETEHGHREADRNEARAEVERLRAALKQIEVGLSVCGAHPDHIDREEASEIAAKAAGEDHAKTP